MEEVIFTVEQSDEGGVIASGNNVSIFTQAETLEELRKAIKDAVLCHFEDGKQRKSVIVGDWGLHD